MPRKPLDSESQGTTAKMEVRVPESVRDAIRDVLEPQETQSQFVRLAIDREVKRRQRRKDRS